MRVFCHYKDPRTHNFYCQTLVIQHSHTPHTTNHKPQTTHSHSHSPKYHLYNRNGSSHFHPKALLFLRMSVNFRRCPSSSAAPSHPCAGPSPPSSSSSAQPNNRRCGRSSSSKEVLDRNVHHRRSPEEAGVSFLVLGLLIRTIKVPIDTRTVPNRTITVR